VKCLQLQTGIFPGVNNKHILQGFGDRLIPSHKEKSWAHNANGALKGMWRMQEKATTQVTIFFPLDVLRPAP